MDLPQKVLPPGSSGIPVLGETLTFLKNGFAFVEERVQKLGPVFRTRILGRPTVVIVGPDASGEFINDAHVQRAGAMPPHIQTLFGGQALPILDGEQHLERKRFVLAAFTREALTGYLPVMQEVIDRYCESWASGGEVGWLEQFKRLSIEVICETMLGLKPGPVLDQLRADYDLIGGGFANLPIPLPGTAYTRAKQALKRILDVFERATREHLAHPKMDGLARILASRSPTTGQGISIEEVKVELHHIVVAGFIVWAWLSTAVLELERNPELRQRLRLEIDRELDEGPFTIDGLVKLAQLHNFAMEVRRTSPVVHVFFGKARQAFEFKGYTIPAGWMVLWGHRSSHTRPDIYQQPEKFDPSRFAPPRSEHLRHEHAFVPNGAGPATGHKCAGYEFAPLLLQVFTAELLRGYEWQWASPQDFTYNWVKLPPEPKDGLRVRVRRRSAAEHTRQRSASPAA